MDTIIIIIAVVAGLFGIGAFILSDKGSPKDRAAEAAGAAGAGAMFAGSCVIQLIIAGLGGTCRTLVTRQDSWSLIYETRQTLKGL